MLLLLGFILLAIAVAAAVILGVQNSGDIRIHALGAHWDIPAYWLAIGGLIIMLIFVIALILLRAGAVRQGRRRRAHRELARENARLTEQLSATPAFPSDTTTLPWTGSPPPPTSAE